ncbi:MAG: hypothetical protein RL685_6941 [Pseudomonadota bacterium]|jgi:hypothetical protein
MNDEALPEIALVKRAVILQCYTRRCLLAPLVCFALLGAFACGGGNAAEGQDLSGIKFFDWDEAAGRPRGPRPFFSFFVTTQLGLFSLGAGQHAPAPDPVNGYGGDLGGIAGADEICSKLAQRSNPGDTKLWRAFLSTAGAFGGLREDAIDRIGTGPWYDFAGRKLAENLAGLLPAGDREGRPSGADPQLAAMFTGENGERVRDDVDIDNHDVLTGSGGDGRLFDDGEAGVIATCEDWTSKSRQGRPGGPSATGGQVPVGHSWPRSNTEGRHWISEHTVNGCEPGVDTDGGTAAPRDDFRVGAAGGYGGFYCFALNAVPPEPLTP